MITIALPQEYTVYISCEHFNVSEITGLDVIGVMAKLRRFTILRYVRVLPVWRWYSKIIQNCRVIWCNYLHNTIKNTDYRNFALQKIKQLIEGEDWQFLYFH